MTVGELIANLQSLDPDRLVVLQKDGEGNGYRPAGGVDDNSCYFPSERQEQVNLFCGRERFDDKTFSEFWQAMDLSLFCSSVHDRELAHDREQNLPGLLWD
jgi:hypothetical protein